MKETWTLLFANQKAEKELLSLSEDLQANFLHISEMLQDFGPINVGLPHIKPLMNKMWEIRLSGKRNIARSIYILATGKRIIILHTFIKKTQKTPMKALKIAESRIKEITNE